MKKTAFTISATLIATMMFAAVSHASYIDLGTLDVKPVTANGGNPDWFVEYGKPGDKIIEYVQIANFAPVAKTIQLYTTDSSTKLGKNFLAKEQEEKPDRLAPWIKMPASTLTLKAGETKLVPVTFTLPQNAGVGLHTGAVMVREQVKGDTTSFNVEKGVRVYFNVTGNVVDAAKMNSFSVQNGFNGMTVLAETANKGTTDFESTITLGLQNFQSETVSQNSLDAYLRPGESGTFSLNTTSPDFGLYHLVLSSDKAIDGLTNATVGTLAVIPWWALMLVLAFVFGASFVTVKEKRTFAVPEFNFGEIIGSGSFQKGASFVGMFAMVLMLIGPLTSLTVNRGLMTDVLGSGNPDTYQVTVKWGNLRRLPLNSNMIKWWHGQVNFKDAKISVDKNLDLEINDAVNVINDGTTLSFNVQTNGRNNDGIVLNVTPTSTVSPVLTFENFDTNTKQEFTLNELIGSSVIIPNKQFSAQIMVKTAGHGLPSLTGLTTENMATGENNATGENATTPEVRVNIPELRAIFNDIPATPEVLSEFILSSDYVKKVTTENASTKIETDPVLIRALSATPEIVDEITATPTLNFTFIPSSSITFPPQAFSFDQNTTSSQSLGTILFVQNKESDWNTYISSTNFVSLSGRGVIGAGNLTIDPGNAKILKQTDGTIVDTGDNSTLKGTFDKSVLVSVQPSGESDQKTIFIMNPQLKINIPKGTAPGRYHGMLTISSL